MCVCQFIGELVTELEPFSAYSGEFVGNVGDPVDKWCILVKGSGIKIFFPPNNMHNF